MALKPIQFVRRRRDPSLIEQAFVGGIAGLAGSLAQKKFITDPAARAREEHDTAERIAKAEEVQARDKRNLADELLVLGKRATAQRKTEAARLAGVETARIGSTQTIEDSLAFIEPLVQELGIDFDLEEEGIQGPTFPEGTDPQQAVDVLAQLRATETAEDRGAATAVASERNRLARQESRIQHLRLNAIPREDLEPALIRDENGVVGFLSEAEINIRTTQQAADRAIEIGFEVDFFTGLQSKARDVESRLVKVPEYSAAAETDWLGRMRGLVPGSEFTGIFNGLTGVLEQAGFAGGFGRGEDPWFIDDQGKKIETKGDADLLARMPGEAPSRIRGALWARMFFPDPSKFDAALLRHGIVDPLAEETYRRIKGLASRGGVVRQVSDARPAAGAAEEFLSATAQRVAGGNKEAVEQINSFVTDFESGLKELSYNVAREQVDVLLALPEDELRSALEGVGAIAKPQPAIGTGPGGFSPAIEPPVIEKDRLRMDWYAILFAAQQEAAERARRRGETTPEQLIEKTPAGR